MRCNKIIAAVIILIANAACSNPEVAKEEKQPLYALKDKFKYQDLREFSIDTLGFGNRAGYYEEVDSNSFKLIFQEGDRQYVSQGDERDYYYSWQNRDSNFIEFVILSQDENGYCSVLRYYIFDRKGKFISKFDLAASCADAGWVFKGEGRKVDINDFETVTVESNFQDTGAPEEETQEVDSIRYSIQVTPTGKITKKETFKKHFVKN